MGMSLSLRIVIVLAAVLLLVPQHVNAADAIEKIPKFIRIPVFYFTDRNRIDDGKKPEQVRFGTDRKYRGACGHELFMGMAFCSIRNTENKKLTDCIGDLCWTAADRGGGPMGTALASGESYNQMCNSFFNYLYIKADATTDRQM